MNTKRAPKVRFKGFTDAWELRKLRDVTTEIVAGGDIDKDLILDEGRYPVIANALTNDGIVGYYNTDYRIEAPAVTVTGRGDVGHAKARIVDFTPVVRLLSIKSYHDVFFLENAINTLKIVIESTGVPQLTVPQLAKYEISFPKSLDEEEKIGNFFCTIDNLITLHQRKLDKMKELKKTFLNLIFSQKLRFRGFTDSWELRKLGEITEKITRKNQSLESLLPLTISAQHGLIDQNSFFNKQIASKDVSGYYLIKNGEFAYNKSYSNAYPWGAIKRLDLHDKGVLSTLYIVFKPTNVESNFLVSYYSADNWHKEVSIRAAEGARNHGLLNISPQDFFETKLLIPNKYEEQEKIGVFFKKLDNLIIFNQDKSNRLKNVKKILLRNMLI